ncbi:DUF2786 domain-containing protein [Leisingera sp. MMG026]|uniref:DUF7168 domain-containing protein n=1 Tax=Leisingera sp. MMG026 TaxID=2909982 RepID=UPI001F19AFBF|nr:DUF2786 domain-containing protein [Leisingera sp. MMG026]MCF6432637.1 DUF2786 domain-containing protein [Leisingera sp. MMG026]
MNADRDRNKRKIEALRQMTVRTGCTEAEALAAAERAAKLMKEHGIADVELGIERSAIKAKSMGRGARDFLWSVLTDCTNTVLVFDPNQSEAIFLGEAPGSEIAAYLYTVLNRAIDRAVRDYKCTASYRRRKTVSSKRAAVHDFTSAMALRLAHKLRALFAGGVSEKSKNRAVAARDAAFPTLTKVSAPERKTKFNPKAASAGMQAAAGVELAHGVGGERTDLIGGVT